MNRYRRKEIIEGIQFTKENVGEIVRFAPDAQISFDLVNNCYEFKFKFKKTAIPCQEGDYIVRMGGEFRIIEKELFEHDWEDITCYVTINGHTDPWTAEDFPMNEPGVG